MYNYFGMLSEETEARLCSFIRAIADHERHLEIFRQVLAEAVLFAPYAAFMRIDRLRAGVVTAADLKAFLLYLSRCHP